MISLQRRRSSTKSWCISSVGNAASVFDNVRCAHRSVFPCAHSNSGGDARLRREPARLAICAGHRPGRGLRSGEQTRSRADECAWPRGSYRGLRCANRRADRVRGDAGAGCGSQERRRAVEGDDAGLAAVAHQTFSGRVLVGPRAAGPQFRLHPQRHAG